MISTSLDSANFAADNRYDASCPNSPTTNPEWQQLAEYAVYLDELREEEQRALARGLHNLIGQSLTSIGLGVEAARLSSGHDELAHLLNDLKEIVRVAADDVQSLLRQLRPGALDHLGVEAALQGLIRAACDADIDCRFESLLQPRRRFNPRIETAIFRIVQQFLRNLVRTAGTIKACISLRNNGNCLELELVEYGSSLVADPQRSKFSGLQGIEQRVELLQGSVSITTRVGEWTRILVTLPNTLEMTSC